MLLMIHVLIAFVSIGYSGFSWIRPSRKNLYVSYALVGVTLLSGVVMVIIAHASLVSACVTGLVYLGVVTFGLVGARNKLAAEKSEQLPLLQTRKIREIIK